jgi:uncharacterized membrane protein YqjE
VIDRLSETASIVVRQAGAYTDLIRGDLDVAKGLLRQRLTMASIAGLALQLAAVLACVWAIAISWDTAARLWVIGGLFAGFALVAVLALWRLNALNAQAPTLLGHTAREWEKDRQVLEELLARARAEAS